jgi:hypothetical protein
MHLYEVNFHSVVSPYRGDLILPFREVTVRKLHKVRGKTKTENKITCHRVREFMASALGNTIFYTHLGPVDREKGTLSVDALITLTFILLELKEEDFFRKNSAEEFTTSIIRLSQFAEFNHFLLRRTDKEKVPPVISAHFHYRKNPLFFRVQ